jgi:hypothetical protein
LGKILLKRFTRQFLHCGYHFGRLLAFYGNRGLVVRLGTAGQIREKRENKKKKKISSQSKIPMSATGR